MQTFHCDHCAQLVFFENVRCERCAHTLGYLSDRATMAALEPADSGLWQSLNASCAGRLYRMCRNYTHENVCNWMLPAEECAGLCVSCRLTHVIPPLGVPQYRTYWYRLEQAKRRLVYTLVSLQLPLTGKAQDAERGLAFEFLADAASLPRVVTGHDGGVITINIAEADDAERERRRLAMGEPYRTLLGHFRHESGHYYWERLIVGTKWHDAFRRLFGEETQDYTLNLQRHYQAPAPDWQQRHVSAYASAHPWEDWAESWAHYLHMIDTLETAQACGLALYPSKPEEPVLTARADGVRSFDDMLERWFALTYVLNSLNRSLGMPDGYPFSLAPLVLDKLSFVHQVVQDSAAGTPTNVPR
jgi:hypothetical protein